jgi:hypothetical protein
MPNADVPDCASTSTHKTSWQRSVGTDYAILHAMPGPRPTLLLPPNNEDYRIRYRWIIGHHAAFGLWQLLAQKLKEIEQAATPSCEAVHTAAQMYEVYSVLFLYTGSCSPSRYAATVRADMARCDPGFTALWARDYEAIPHLLLTIKQTHPQALIAPLLQASKLNHRIHMATAHRLVPNGPSLYQSARYNTRHPTNSQRDLFDAYFLVERTLTCQRTRTAQLHRRIAQIICDITAYGLTPTSPSVESYEATTAQISYDALPILLGFADSLCRNSLL